MLEQYAPLAEEAGIALRDETAPAPLVADEDLLIQVLVNLIDNALAHTPPGARSSLAAGRTTAGSTSGSATPVRASPRSTRRGSSIASTGSTPAAAATRAAPGWGWRSARRSSRRTGERLGWTSRPGSGTHVELRAAGWAAATPEECSAMGLRTALMPTSCARSTVVVRRQGLACRGRARSGG